MSVDQIGEDLPRVVVSGSADTMQHLLLSVARGDQEALVDLHRRMAGLVRLNAYRVLGDASRSDAVTRAFFAELPRAANDYEPDRDSARTWLLTRAHEQAVHDLRSIHAAPVSP